MTAGVTNGGSERTAAGGYVNNLTIDCCSAGAFTGDTFADRTFIVNSITTDPFSVNTFRRVRSLDFLSDDPPP
jgi:hypothetical protein